MPVNGELPSRDGEEPNQPKGESTYDGFEGRHLSRFLSEGPGYFGVGVVLDGRPCRDDTDLERKCACDDSRSFSGTLACQADQLPDGLSLLAGGVNSH
jgi:hypothetical protein